MTFHPNTVAKINGWGQVLRFVTPMLVSVGLWIMADMKTEIRDIRIAASQVASDTVIFNNKITAEINNLAGVLGTSVTSHEKRLDVLEQKSYGFQDFMNGKRK